MNAGIPLTPHSTEKIGHGVLSWRNLQAKSQRQHPPKAEFAHRAGGLGQTRGGWVPGGQRIFKPRGKGEGRGREERTRERKEGARREVGREGGMREGPAGEAMGRGQEREKWEENRRGARRKMGDGVREREDRPEEC